MSRRRSLFTRPYDSLHAASAVHARIAAGATLEHEAADTSSAATKRSRRGESAKTQRRTGEGKFA